jgi:hypothetical protein
MVPSTLAGCTTVRNVGANGDALQMGGELEPLVVVAARTERT